MPDGAPVQAVLKANPLDFIISRPHDVNTTVLQSAAWYLIIEAARAAAIRLLKGGTLWVCGNGGSAEQANHLAAELVGRYAQERPAFRAFSLAANMSTVTAIANDYGWDAVFSRQLQVGTGADILVAISTSGKSQNILAALGVARSKGMKTICLGPRDQAAPMFALADYKLRAWEFGTPATQENHLILLHHLAGLVEHLMLNPPEDM